MSNYPTDLKYTKNDEWVKVNGDAATAGLTFYAQEQLSDIVFVELPSVGATLKQGETFASVESVKAASDVYMPIGGEITEINESLSDTPELVNQDPYGKAWMIKFKIANASELSGLMDAAAYEKYCAERAH
ncbi:MAG: glycine cleavage system protein GcvH [Chloroflexi bacterium]|nr:glycine cleavage system protein GcvH [Chloroflexota bacterium]MBI5081496.1 glycine cleavage system protein GcvH [Chloroflexota bacterium]MBI5714766.1 glycine cleavage system protein GcvH [Chloroflexota bacterium]